MRTIAGVRRLLDAKPRLQDLLAQRKEGDAVDAG